MSLFKKATKTESKLRMAISGPSGSGKTYTALEVATGLMGIDALDGKAPDGTIAVIDTEHGSARKYADRFNFDVIELDSFHHNKYIEAIEAAVKEGFKVLIIDSLSHCWFGKDGAMEQVDKASQKSNGQAGNKFAAWSGVTPLQNKLIDTIISSNLHIIATMRTKTEYVVEEKNGKQVPRKIGLAPIQREGVDYEFDLATIMNLSNVLTVEKTRCSILVEKMIDKPDRRLSEVLLDWLSGEPVPEPVKMATKEQGKQMAEFHHKMFDKDVAMKVAHLKKHNDGAERGGLLTFVQMEAYIERLKLTVDVIDYLNAKYGEDAKAILTASLAEYGEGYNDLDDMGLIPLRAFVSDVLNTTIPENEKTVDDGIPF